MLEKRRTSVTDFNFHLVFTTKFRKEVFTTREKVDAMKAILQRIADNKGVVVQEMEVMPDHVHMLISFHPKMAASDVVKSLKGTSAREWFKHYPETKAVLWKGHLWTNSFFMSTIGNISKKIVAQYIRDQMESSLKKESGTE